MAFNLVPFIVFIVSLSLAAAGAASFDDTSPIYSYAGTWVSASARAPCATCHDNVDVKQAFGQTFHYGVPGSTGQIRFTGSGLTVLGINFPNASNIAYTLDGSPQTAYKPVNVPRPTLNVKLYDVQGLPAMNHVLNFNIEKGDAGGVGAYIDYSVIAAPDNLQMPAGNGTNTNSTNGSSNHLPRPVIIGFVIGFVAMLL